MSEDLCFFCAAYDGTRRPVQHTGQHGQIGLAEEREARWAAERARQEAYRNSPEALAKRAARIAAGLCVVDDGQCITHGVKADLGHDLDINGTTRADGTARNDEENDMAHNPACMTVEAHSDEDCSTTLTREQAIAFIAQTLWTRGMGNRKGGPIAAAYIVDKLIETGTLRVRDAA